MNEKRLWTLVMVAVLCLNFCPQILAYDMARTSGGNVVSASYAFTAVIDSNASLWMWGDNSMGQLGNGRVGNNVDEQMFSWWDDEGNEGYSAGYYQTVPVKVLDNVISVSTGSVKQGNTMPSQNMTAAVKSDKSLWVWGNGGLNFLDSDTEAGNDTVRWGRHTWPVQTVPKKIMDDVAAVSVSGFAGLAIKTDGSLWRWGDYTGSLSPSKIMDDVISACAGPECDLAIKSDGSLWQWGAWGFDDSDYYDEGDSESSQNPKKIMDDVAHIAINSVWDSGASAIIGAVKKDGTLWMWGSNMRGVLGDADSSVPTKMMDGVSSVSLGYDHVAVIKTDKSLWTWGRNHCGQLGVGSADENYDAHLTPAKIMDNVASVSAGISYTVAVKTDGSVWAWGDNELGALGNNGAGDVKDDSLVYQTTPVKVMDNTAIPGSLPEPVDGDLPPDSPSNGEFFTEPVYEADTFEDYVSATSALIHKYEYILDAASDSSQYATARLIVSAKNPLPNMENYNAAQIVVDESYHYLIQFYTAKEAEYCANYLKTLPYVNYSEPDMIVSGNAERISAALEANSWGVYAIGADSYAANLRQRGVSAQVTVAVVDSGIDSDHPFLKDRVLPGYDLVEDDATPQDGAWHGTHVSGTIVDCTPNLNVKILPVRVLDDDGTGYDSTVGEGIQYAANHGAKVINLSLSGPGQSEYIDSCISYAISRNVTVVVAAGNDNSDTANFSPAHNKDCITVAAADARRSKAIFSNYGEAVDIAAPGVNIRSCVPGNRYDAWDGTSMAAPHVSAAAALLLYENANLTPKQIEERLTGMAVDIGETGWDPYYGAGFLSLGNPGSMEIGPVPIAFTDVPSDAYYYQAVIWAIENGITNGTTSTTFSPDDVCTTAQILTFIWRASGSPSPNASSSAGVSSSYFSQALAWANEKEIRGAFAANAANSACTRAAAMTYMWNDAGKRKFRLCKRSLMGSWARHYKWHDRNHIFS